MRTRILILAMFLPACVAPFETSLFADHRDGGAAGSGGSGGEVGAGGAPDAGGDVRQADAGHDASADAAPESGPGPTCAHDPCAAGAGLDPSCDPCVASVCALAANCCTGAWDASCLSLARQLKTDGTACPSSCPGATCAHSPCVVGAPLAGTHADACLFVVYHVCGDMPDCCAPGGAWTAACVNAAVTFGQICL